MENCINSENIAIVGGESFFPRMQKYAKDYVGGPHGPLFGHNDLQREFPKYAHSVVTGQIHSDLEWLFRMAIRIINKVVTSQ